VAELDRATPGLSERFRVVCRNLEKSREFNQNSGSLINPDFTVAEISCPHCRRPGSQNPTRKHKFPHARGTFGAVDPVHACVMELSPKPGRQCLYLAKLSVPHSVPGSRYVIYRPSDISWPQLHASTSLSPNCTSAVSHAFFV
jgi:hypothetical protein